MINHEELSKNIAISLAADASLAHATVFPHRHESVTPPFHEDVQRSFYSHVPKLLYWVFRGGAKSSIAEEALVLGAVFKRFNNCVIVGANEARAVERLDAVKHELKHNELISELFGGQVGEVWGSTKILLANGVCIQALGQGQDLRGIKHLQYRPDFSLLDDLEKREDAWTPAARQKMKQWFFGEFFPALDPNARVRMNATPLDNESLSVTFSKLKDWRVITVPIKVKHPKTGKWEPTWKDRFPLQKIDETEESYANAGMLDTFMREYMVQATADELKAFKPEYFRYAHVARSFEAVYAMYDPARTAKETSAHTGYVVYSWLGNKLIVWESGGHFWQPSEIVDHIFKINSTYNPVFIAVEKDGLEEFILQPLRQESVRRGVMLPIKDVRAPKGKLDFIRALEPFFKAGEITLVGTAQDHAQLTSQLENFPTGKIDVPNALAYAPRLRIGTPVFEDFTSSNVEPELEPLPNEQFFLAVNASTTSLTAILCQLAKGSLRIYRDFAAEGDAGAVLSMAVQEALLYTDGRAPKLVAPRPHFTTYDAVGLRPAARAIPAQLHRGGELHQGREALRRLLRTRLRGEPALRIAPEASIALRAFAGGYAMPVNIRGELAEPVSNVYSIMMNGLEALTALPLSSIISDADNTAPGWAVAADGRRYRSAKV